MEHAFSLEVVHLRPRKVLLQYDAKAHAAKLQRQPHLYATSSTEDHEVVAEDPRVAAYTDVLDFITGAQQECYALFGDDEGRWSVDDAPATAAPGHAVAAVDGPGTSTRGSSLHINSSEWSEDDSATDGAAGRKRKRSHA